MSYSFSVRAATLAAASLAIASQLDDVTERQPIHERDRAATDTAVANFLALAREPGEGHEIAVSVAGSCYGAEGEPFDGITVSISISRLAKTG